MSQLRTWCGRAAVVAAAAASIATKRPAWSLDATWPAGAPARTPGDDARGLVVTVAATAPPHVECRLDGDIRELEPLAGTTDRFLCPPGGWVSHVWISGNASGGCSKPEPPSDQSVRITSAALVATWNVTAERRAVDVTYDSEIGAGIAHVSVRSPYRAWVTATVEGSADTIIPLGPYTDGTKYDIVVPMASTDHRSVTVRAAIYGTCAAEPCTAPADATLEVVP